MLFETMFLWTRIWGWHWILGTGYSKMRMVIKWKSDELFTLESITFIVCRSHQNNPKVIDFLLFHFTIILTLEDLNPKSSWWLNKSNNTRTYSDLVFPSWQWYLPVSAITGKFESIGFARCNNGTFLNDSDWYLFTGCANSSSKTTGQALFIALLLCITTAFTNQYA